MIADLLSAAGNRPAPLQDLKSPSPGILHIPVSFTCHVGCLMCNAGFQDRTSLFPDRKYLLPKEMADYAPWIETATHINFSGFGETLESPHIPELLEKISHKISMVTTSGVPLNKAKMIALVRAGLKYLNLSYDGETTLGHGGINSDYAEKFWRKVEMIQQVKSDLNSHFPILILVIVVNRENLPRLDALLESALSRNVRYVDLVAMLPVQKEFQDKSIFSDFDHSLERIREIQTRWNARGMQVTLAEQEYMQSKLDTCYFVDNFLLLNPVTTAPKICCGPVNIPLNFEGLSKEQFWHSFPLRYLRHLHFYGEPVNWPAPCTRCIPINPKYYAETLKTGFSNEALEDRAFALYTEASHLKQDIPNAEEKFLAVLNLTSDNILMGKTYFHLGELSIKRGDYPEAFSRMKLAVQNCFDHGKAFACLYLLCMILNEPSSLSPKKQKKETYLEKISRAHGLLEPFPAH